MFATFMLVARPVSALSLTSRRRMLAGSGGRGPDRPAFTASRWLRRAGSTAGAAQRIVGVDCNQVGKPRVSDAYSAMPHDHSAHPPPAEIQLLWRLAAAITLGTEVADAAVLSVYMFSCIYCCCELALPM